MACFRGHELLCEGALRFLHPSVSFWSILLLLPCWTAEHTTSSVSQISPACLGGSSTAEAPTPMQPLLPQGCSLLQLELLVVDGVTRKPLSFAPDPTRDLVLSVHHEEGGQDGTSLAPRSLLSVGSSFPTCHHQDTQPVNLTCILTSRLRPHRAN